MTDPYAYLEDGDDARTVAWQAASNASARASLDALPFREALHARFDRLTRTGSLGAPVVRGPHTFLFARTGTRDQPTLALALDGGVADRVILDPLAIDPRGLTTIDWWYPSPHGRYVAYGLSTNGDELSTLHVLDVTGATTPGEAIPRTRWSSLAWLPDESGFYYTRHAADSDYDQRLMLHVLGTAHAADSVIFGEGRPREDMFECDLSEDGRWLVVTSSHGWTESELHLADRSRAGDLVFVPIFSVPGALARVHASERGLVILTTDGAPKGRVYLVDPERPARADWQEVVREGADAIQFARPCAAGILLGTMHDVMGRLELRTHGGRMHAIPLGIVTLGNLAADSSSAVAYLTTTSFFEPTTVRRLACSPDGTVVTTWRALAPAVDASAYVVSQRWCESKDGTRVPMFVLAAKATPRDGTAPGIVYGYGGFAVPITPDYLPHAVPWLDAGGVYAIVNLRGGSEFGEAWHEAGMRERKQNVFDDYAAAITFLGREGDVDPARVAIFGGSNGGLLVAALATQHPKLARAVLCLVPVIDMLRYHLFSIGRLWIPEFGDPDVPEDAAFLRRYSPYERVESGTAYPAMLIRSATSDSRVDPMHARKFAAKVRDAQGGDAPILCFIEAEAGHGQGKPRHKVLDELVDRYAFLAWQLGVDPATLAGAGAVEVTARN